MTMLNSLPQQLKSQHYPGFNNAASTWSSDVTVMYNTIRSTGNTNIILIPCDNYDSTIEDFTSGSLFLSGKSNVVATLHLLFLTGQNGMETLTINRLSPEKSIPFGMQDGHWLLANAAVPVLDL